VIGLTRSDAAPATQAPRWWPASSARSWPLLPLPRCRRVRVSAGGTHAQRKLRSARWGGAVRPLVLGPNQAATEAWPLAPWGGASVYLGVGPRACANRVLHCYLGVATGLRLRLRREEPPVLLPLHRALELLSHLVAVDLERVHLIRDLGGLGHVGR